MKINLIENDGCFSFRLTAETLVDAALLTRLGMNATKEVRTISTFVNRDGSFESAVVIGKHKNSGPFVPKRK